MKRLTLGFSFLALSAFSAFSAFSASAADLAARPYTKATPIYAAATYDWSGLYIGANGGYGSSRKCWTISNFLGFSTPPRDEGCHDATGGVAGGQIGYRWQSSAWVFGLEAQGDWADLRGSNPSNALGGFIPNYTNQSRISAFGLFTGQVGYSWSNALLYVKGGAAVTADKYRGGVGLSIGQQDQASETRLGAAVGAGIEYGFTQNWSVALEYDHFFMGRRELSFVSPVFPYQFCLGTVLFP